jgi:hypothetical protein
VKVVLGLNNIGRILDIRLRNVQAAEQTAHPNSGPRRRPGIASNRSTQLGEQPKNGG